MLSSYTKVLCGAAERRHDFTREKVQRFFAHFARDSRNREPADEMARLQLFLKSHDFLHACFRIGQDNPVFREAFNAELALRALDDRVRPPEVHPLECLNKSVSCCADRLLSTARDKNVAEQGDITLAFSCLPAGFPIHAHARCDLVETCGGPNQPCVSKTSGAVKRRVGPGAKPDRRPRPLHGTRRNGDIVHVIMPSVVSDILFRPKALKKGSAFLQSTAALFHGI